MRRKKQSFSNESGVRMPVQIFVKNEHRELLHEFCDKYLGMTISAYLNDLFIHDEVLKRWARENGKKLD